MGQLICKSQRRDSSCRKREREPGDEELQEEEDEDRLSYDRNRRSWQALMLMRSLSMRMPEPYGGHDYVQLKFDSYASSVVSLINSHLPLNGKIDGSGNSTTVFGSLLCTAVQIAPYCSTEVADSLLHSLADRIRQTDDEPIDLDGVMNNGDTLLHVAVVLFESVAHEQTNKEKCVGSRRELVQLITQRIKDPNAKNLNGLSPLLVYMAAGDLPDQVPFGWFDLVRNGADPGSTNSKGQTLLHLMAEAAAVGLLFEFAANEMFGIDWRVRDNKGRDFLQEAEHRLQLYDIDDEVFGTQYSAPRRSEHEDFVKLAKDWVLRCNRYTEDRLVSVGLIPDLAAIVQQYLDGRGKPFDWREREAEADAELEEIMRTPVMPGDADKEEAKEQQ